MKVKIFDCEHENDLEDEINFFLKQNITVIEIHYSTSHFDNNGEQIYSFSCLILYNDN